MGALRWFGFVAGIALFATVVVSVFNVFVLPRQARSEFGLLTARIVRGAVRLVADRMPSYDLRDKILAYGGPGWLLVMLLLWLLLVWTSFALLMWPFLTVNAAFGDALRLSGSGMFTLGFATPDGAAPLILTLGAAASGLGVVSVMIGFLPALYAAFNRREILVTLLDALAGSPAWGPEVLARQELIDNVGALEKLYERWAEWASELSESHTTYRVLVYFRSPSPLRSWVIGLLAMLDAAALHLALNPYSAPSSARWLMRMGIVSLREIALSLRLPVDPDPRPDDPIVLTREEFSEGVAVMTAVGWKPERDQDTAWTHFRGWRVNYEQTAYAIARQVEAPPAPWSGPRNLAGRVIPPARPPHRQPSDISEGIRETTQKRRALRAKRDVRVVAVDTAKHKHADGSPRDAHDHAAHPEVTGGDAARDESADTARSSE